MAWDGAGKPADGETAATIPFPSCSDEWRLLAFGPDRPDPIRLALRFEQAGLTSLRWEWTDSPAEALTALRTEAFDCILISGEPRASFTAEGTLDLVQALRAAGCDEPVVLMAASLDEDDWSEALRANCDVLITRQGWQSPALGESIRRAIARVALSRENHRLGLAQHRRQIRERDEAEHLLHQQHQMIRELQRDASTRGEDGWTDERLARGDEAAERQNSPTDPLTADLSGNYQELLRTYVIMGTGSLGAEIQQLAELMAQAGLSPRDALQLHLQRIESLVKGLGSRSARHVLSRADLLALELMIHLGESYQQRCIGERS